MRKCLLCGGEIPEHAVKNQIYCYWHCIIKGSKDNYNLKKLKEEHVRNLWGKKKASVRKSV